MACINAAFYGNGMGIGRLGDPDIIMKRKFRWTMAMLYCNGQRFVPPSFVKTSARPSLTIEDIEINFLNAKTWIPGKGSWETITVTYHDVNSSENVDLLSWIASVYDFTDPTCLHMNSKRADYAGAALIQMLDGCGNLMEAWTLNDAWPTSINFGDLSYDTSDTCEIELTLRYSQVEYKSFCGGQISPCPCTAC